MPVVTFSQWIPDASDFGNPGSITITNAVPALNSYQPIGTLTAATDALTARPRGAIEALDAASNVFQYAGDETKLYSLVGSSWEDVSNGTYTTGLEEVWEFARWKEKIIATNFSDNPQQITFGGANFSDLTTELRARHIAIVRDFVVFGNTFDGSDGTVRDRVRWSAINDETDYTVSPNTLSDFRDLKAGGGIQQVVGGEYGVICAERSTWRMTWVGSPTVFQIDEVLPGVGALASGGVVQLGNSVFFPSEQGFIELTGGTQHRFIGAGKVDQFFRNDLDEDFLYRMSSVADPKSGKIYWAYPGAGNVAGRPNKIIVYDRNFDKWGLVEEEVELLWRSGGVATTLEELDAFSSSIDALTISLDSSQWKGGAPLLSAFDATFKKANFSGVPMTAVIETKEVEFNAGHRTRVNAFTPIVDGGTVTAKVGTRNRQVDTFSFGSVLNQSNSGRFTTRENARFHRFQLTISEDWKDAIGVEVERPDAPRAERRG